MKVETRFNIGDMVFLGPEEKGAPGHKQVHGISVIYGLDGLGEMCDEPLVLYRFDMGTIQCKEELVWKDRAEYDAKMTINDLEDEDE